MCTDKSQEKASDIVNRTTTHRADQHGSPAFAEDNVDARVVSALLETTIETEIEIQSEATRHPLQVRDRATYPAVAFTGG